MPNAVPNHIKYTLLNDYFSSGTFKVMLLDNNHTNDIDTQDNIDDVNANEISGNGYTAGGETLTNVGITEDDSGDLGAFDADNVTWTGDLTAYYAVVYKDTGDPTTSTIIGIVDFGGEKTASNGDLTIDWDSVGIFTLK